MIKRKSLVAIGMIFAIICGMSTWLGATPTVRSISWYCVRNKDHRQPLADANLQWVEKFGGHYIDHLHGDTNSDKVVYLTFDAGYENGNVAKILDILAQEEVGGAFFILGHLIQSAPDLVRRMAEEGHLVCNHTNLHKDMTKFENREDFQAELEALEQLYQEKIGGTLSKYFRPPEGRFDEKSMGFLESLGYQTIFWSLTYADWDNAKQADPSVAKEILLQNLHNGAVILLHPTSKTNTLILKEFIQTLKQKGYRFGSLDELVVNNQTHKQENGSRIS